MEVSGQNRPNPWVRPCILASRLAYPKRSRRNQFGIQLGGGSGRRRDCELFSMWPMPCPDLRSRRIELVGDFPPDALLEFLASKGNSNPGRISDRF